MNKKELCYVMVKPMFANNPSNIAYVQGRLLALGMEIIDDGYVLYTNEFSAKHYAEHVNKGFYPELRDYITSDKAYGIVVKGENARARIRSIVGSTKAPEEGSIRFEILKKYPNLPAEEKITKNGVHCTDTETDPMREISIFKELREIELSKENGI